MIVHAEFRYNGDALTHAEGATLLEKLEGSSEPWMREHARFMRSWLSDETHIEVQTSGSTGEPKVWSLPKEMFAASAAITGRHFACLNGTRALLCLPSSFIAGKMMLVRAMTLGWALDAIAPTSHPLSVIDDTYDFAAFTPMQLTGLSEREMRRFAAIRTVIVGGAAVPSALRRQLTARGNEVFETYGMAETLSHIAVRRFSQQEVPFEALPGVRFRSDDEGRLIITIKHLGDLLVHTQDVASLIDDRHFYYRGRFDSMINSGGIKLFPEVIEKKLQSTITIPFYIGSEPDEVLGQRVVLYVESAETPDEQQLLGRCREVLTGYEVPKLVRAQYPFDRTESGKIKRIKR